MSTGMGASGETTLGRGFQTSKKALSVVLILFSSQYKGHW